MARLCTLRGHMMVGGRFEKAYLRIDSVGLQLCWNDLYQEKHSPFLKPPHRDAWCAPKTQVHVTAGGLLKTQILKRWNRFAHLSVTNIEWCFDRRLVTDWVWVHFSSKHTVAVICCLFWTVTRPTPSAQRRQSCTCALLTRPDCPFVLSHRLIHHLTSLWLDNDLPLFQIVANEFAIHQLFLCDAASKPIHQQARVSCMSDKLLWSENENEKRKKKEEA